MRSKMRQAAFVVWAACQATSGYAAATPEELKDEAGWHVYDFEREMKAR